MASGYGVGVLAGSMYVCMSLPTGLASWFKGLWMDVRHVICKASDDYVDPELMEVGFGYCEPQPTMV